jgi:hypothetical protein
MDYQSPNLSSVSFSEHPCLTSDQQCRDEFDIVIVAPYSKEKYISSLFKKIYEIGLSEFVPFLDYQLEYLKDPNAWLNSLEKIIKLYAFRFTGPDLSHRHHKLMTEIGIKRQEIKFASLGDYRQKLVKNNINAFSDKRIYCFDDVKKHLKNIDSITDKLVLLQGEVFEYRQDEHVYVCQGGKTFDTLCELEIQKIDRNEELRMKAELKLNSGPVAILGKMRIHCNLNAFVDLVFQMMHEIKIDDSPLLEASNIQVATFISQHFLDKNGNSITVKAVQTILEINRPEKRPKADKKFKIV